MAITRNDRTLRKFRRERLIGRYLLNPAVKGLSKLGMRTALATELPPSLTTASWATSRLRSPNTTLAPSAMNRSAIAYPIPCAPPVITAVRPSSNTMAARPLLVN